MFCHTSTTSASSLPTPSLSPGWRARPGILHSTGKALPAKWLSGTRNADTPILARGCIHGKGMGKDLDLHPKTANPPKTPHTTLVNLRRACNYKLDIPRS
ncbi:uncharacterized protein VTP21DRAFT_5827 [Calcarisporiella thermophila]|uniref:uncharacterized protein n=1 Tax=Calcarisporiella thermophila TaxID=911321 RepID=UPI00374264B0